jgi:hypothetical protein
MKTAKSKQAKPAKPTKPTKVIQAAPEQQKADLKRAAVLMQQYVQAVDNKARLESTIANEQAAYIRNIKEAYTELLEIGERNKNAFDKDGNLYFDKGYLHIAKQSVIVPKRKFNWLSFLQVKPDFAKIDFAVDRIKKAFLNKDERNELQELGITVSTQKVVQVKILKDKAPAE